MSVDPTTDAELVLSQVRSVLDDLFGEQYDTVTLQSDLAGDLGLDSLAAVELHDRLEDAFGVTLPDDVLAEASTPGEWLRAVVEARGGAGHPGRSTAVTPPAVRPAGEEWPKTARTLTEALAWHAERHPDLVSIRILGSGGPSPARELTYRALADHSTTLAHGLLASGLDQGGRVAIMLPTGPDYFMAFLGTLLAGGVPVPIYPPVNPSVLEQHVDRQTQLLENAGASILVAESETQAMAPELCRRVSALRAVCTPRGIAETGGPTVTLPLVGADDTALIQYTSGSTSDPKGVVLSHAQILANVRSLGRRST